jgi:hypothetical protein
MVFPEISGHISGEDAQHIYARVMGAAELQGKSIYDELVQEHTGRIKSEQERGEYAFRARRRAVERVGLPTVRNYRLSQLEQEERTWRDELAMKTQVSPEMMPVILIRLVGTTSND